MDTRGGRRADARTQRAVDEHISAQIDAHVGDHTPRYDHVSRAARDELLPYRLRVVRVGVIASMIAIGLLAAYPPVVGLETFPRVGAFYALLLVAALAVGIVAVLPWEQLFRTRWGMRIMYVWSVGDIVIISAEVALTGGMHSELWVVYILTTIFFATSYPVRSQIALLAFTGAAYAVAGLFGPSFEVAAFVIRFGALGLLTFMGGFLSLELMRQMGEHSAQRREAEHHAAILDQVVGATRRLQSLDPDEVLDTVVGTVASLGLTWAAIAELDQRAGTFHVVRGQGLPPELASAHHEIEGALTELLSTGRTVTSDTSSNEPVGAWEDVEGFVVAPIHVRGEVVAILGGATLDETPVGNSVAEAVELLASLAGRALELADAYEQERESVRRLERLDQLKRDFVSNVSHELRTPLTVMMGVGELLRGRWADLPEAKRDDLLDRQLSHIGALDRTIGTLLDFSRLEAGRLATRPEPTNVSTLVMDVCDRLERLTRTHHFTFTVEDACVAIADPQLLERVVDNLIINAVTHTPAGTTVQVQVRRSGSSVEVEVADDGPGIPQDDLQHLTDRFFRGGDPDTRPTRGLGLGLALAHDIVEQHGSRLEIESVVGQGARFSFRLPAADVGVTSEQLVG